jgi:hypothetical protein
LANVQGRLLINLEVRLLSMVLCIHFAEPATNLYILT